MPTWGEIQEYVRSKYKLSKDLEDRFSLVFSWGDVGRAQQITVRKFSAFNQEWVEFYSACCKENEMAPAVALKKNGQFHVGALCLDKGFYLFRYSVPLGTLDIEEFELPLHVVAETADRIEQDFTAGDVY